MCVPRAGGRDLGFGTGEVEGSSLFRHRTRLVETPVLTPLSPLTECRGDATLDKSAGEDGSRVKGSDISVPHEVRENESFQGCQNCTILSPKLKRRIGRSTSDTKVGVWATEESLGACGPASEWVAPPAPGSPAHRESVVRRRLSGEETEEPDRGGKTKVPSGAPGSQGLRD